MCRSTADVGRGDVYYKAASATDTPPQGEKETLHATNTRTGSPFPSCPVPSPATSTLPPKRVITLLIPRPPAPWSPPWRPARQQHHRRWSHSLAMEDGGVTARAYLSMSPISSAASPTRPCPRLSGVAQPQHGAGDRSTSGGPLATPHPTPPLRCSSGKQPPRAAAHSTWSASLQPTLVVGWRRHRRRRRQDRLGRAVVVLAGAAAPTVVATRSDQGHTTLTTADAHSGSGPGHASQHASWHASKVGQAAHA